MLLCAFPSTSIFTILSLSAAPYSIVLSALTDGVWSLIIFLYSGERENHLWAITSSSLYLMFGHVVPLNWLRFWTRVLLCLLCISSSIYIYIYIYIGSSLIFFYFAVVDCQSEPVTLRALPTPPSVILQEFVSFSW